MARDKGTLQNISNSDPTNYPNGRLRNNDGSGNGTPVNEFTYGDIQEFFGQLMRLYGITYTGLPDNTANGYQLVEAVTALASKNDFVLPITSASGTLNVPLKLAFAKEGESFLCLSQVDRAAEVLLRGSQDSTVVSRTINFKGGDFKTGEYVRLVITGSGVDLIRLSDGAAFDIIAAENGYLRAADQAQENAGAITSVASTPLTNFTALIERLNGTPSSNFLATALRNGLMSMADKIALDALTAAPLSQRETIEINPVNFDSASSRSHTLGGVPFLTQTFIECVTTHTLAGRTYSIGERVTVASQNDGENNDLESVQVTLKAGAIDVLVSRIKVFGSSVARGTSGEHIIPANWKLIIELFR